MLYALKFLCGMILATILWPPWMLCFGNAALGDYLYKRRVALALSSTEL